MEASVYPSVKWEEPPSNATTHGKVPSPLLSRCPQAYEKQRGARREEQKELQRAAAQDQVRGFLEKEAAIVSRPLNPFTPKAAPETGPGEGERTCRGARVPQDRVPRWVRHPGPSPSRR